MPYDQKYIRSIEEICPRFVQCRVLKCEEHGVESRPIPDRRTLTVGAFSSD